MKTTNSGSNKNQKKWKKNNKNTLLDYKSSSVMLSRCGRHTATRPRRRSLAVEAFSFMISDRYLSLASSRSFSPSAPPPPPDPAAAATLQLLAARQPAAASRALAWSFLLRRLFATAAVWTAGACAGAAFSGAGAGDGAVMTGMRK
uniref:Uncharacterized protein n=1 Tax=Arundo donax TaxID=35708 RepID=A0A0A9CWQ6_ARUDO